MRLRICRKIQQNLISIFHNGARGWHGRKRRPRTAQTRFIYLPVARRPSHSHDPITRREILKTRGLPASPLRNQPVRFSSSNLGSSACVARCQANSGTFPSSPGASLDAEYPQRRRTAPLIMDDFLDAILRRDRREFWLLFLFVWCGWLRWSTPPSNRRDPIGRIFL